MNLLVSGSDKCVGSKRRAKHTDFSRFRARSETGSDWTAMRFARITIVSFVRGHFLNGSR